MVAVPGFPRPLYPPSAAPGYRVSEPGDDVLGIKRTVWRAGRWQGPASNFDTAYSDLFAHGKGGNVSETGVAGVQRQNNIKDTGFIGEPTFNLLRSIRIPDGLPNAGQMAMDATAANLIANAWYHYNPPKPKQTVRLAALEGAIKWLGYKESPTNSNRTVFGSWYGMDGQPWCAMFCAYCFEVEAGGSPSFVRGSRYSYVPYVVNDARGGRNGLSVTNSPQPGDLVCFDWDRDGTFDHIGIFNSGNSSRFQCVEGNTSTGNNSNGGQVMNRSRDPGQGTLVFVRVAEP